jgi:hypothetical protein
MLRIFLATTMLFGVFGVSLPGQVHAADTHGAIQDALQERYQPSRMEMSNRALEGHLSKRGSVLLLQGDGAPAQALRFVQLNTKSPRFHVRDYARATVAQDGALTSGKGDFTLPKGTRLSVLDVKVDRDQVHIFTHTLEPVRLGDGKTAYGCTEFVFPLDPGARNRADVAAVSSEIDRVLRPAANG